MPLAVARSISVCATASTQTPPTGPARLRTCGAVAPASTVICVCRLPKRNVCTAAACSGSVPAVTQTSNPRVAQFIDRFIINILPSTIQATLRYATGVGILVPRQPRPIYMFCQKDFNLIGISAKLVMSAGLLFTATLDAAEVVVEVPTPRVQRLLAAMSREDKMAVIRGGREPADAAQGEAGWTHAVTRLGIPALRFAEGPPGLLVHDVSTGMPSTLSMAATFSRRDAEATGA